MGNSYVDDGMGRGMGNNSVADGMRNVFVDVRTIKPLRKGKSALETHAGAGADAGAHTHRQFCRFLRLLMI